MSDAIGCAMADVFRAIAPMSGGIPNAEHPYSGCDQVNTHPIAVWMSHGDSVVAAPAGFDVLASTPDTPVAAFEDVERGLAGVQWHPEVLHTEHGQKVLEHFLWDIAGCRQTWTIGNIADEQIDRIVNILGESMKTL